MNKTPSVVDPNGLYIVQDTKANIQNLKNKDADVECVFQLIRTLVSPSNPTQVTAKCQRNMSTCGKYKRNYTQ